MSLVSISSWVRVVVWWFNCSISWSNLRRVLSKSAFSYWRLITSVFRVSTLLFFSALLSSRSLSIIQTNAQVYIVCVKIMTKCIRNQLFIQNDQNVTEKKFNRGKNIRNKHFKENLIKLPYYVIMLENQWINLEGSNKGVEIRISAKLRKMWPSIYSSVTLSQHLHIYQVPM